MFTNPVALISIAGPKAVSTTVSLVDSSSYKSFVSLSTVSESDAETTNEVIGDEEEISNEEMTHSYKVM